MPKNGFFATVADSRSANCKSNFHFCKVFFLVSPLSVIVTATLLSRPLQVEVIFSLQRIQTDNKKTDLYCHPY